MENQPTAPKPPKLLDQVSDAIKALHYSSRTGETYTYWIKQFIFFHNKRHPNESGEFGSRLARPFGFAQGAQKPRNENERRVKKTRLSFFFWVFSICPTVCVTGTGAGVDKVWEQKKHDARKMLENGDESHTSTARFVGRVLGIKNYDYKSQRQTVDCFFYAFSYAYATFNFSNATSYKNFLRVAKIRITK
ncbi:hypothetical protein ANRL1_04013 [Anaerolineae bacterium]|nr:hypothetical protein ANRL1_04013 [Anaerolineae bacterium]